MAELRQPARGSFLRALAGVFKLIILIIPWLFVAHGVVVLQAHYAFFNNSVETVAHVVAHEASTTPISVEARQSLIEQPVVDIAPRPAFVYTHENGQIFVGAPVARPYLWKDVFGTKITVRYHRFYPNLAQPVGFFRFWWVPAAYIGGGVVAFLVLAVALYAPPRKGKRRRHGALNLRR